MRLFGACAAVCIICILIWLSGCTATQEAEIDAYDMYHCKNDSECVVKDVHSCCGYYPRCVNINYEPDIKSVISECMKKGVVSVCGFPEVTNCECRENKCASLQDGIVV